MRLKNYRDFRTGRYVCVTILTLRWTLAFVSCMIMLDWISYVFVEKLPCYVLCMIYDRIISMKR